MTKIYENTPISPELSKRLWEMPKAEIHVHLEGATDAATVWELAQRNKVTLPAATLEEWLSMYAFRDFDHFLDIYLLATQCMQTADDFAFMFERFLAEQARHNVRYCEVFLSASFMLDNFPQEEVITVFAEGIKHAKEKYDIGMRFIPDIARHIPESRYRVLDFILKGREAGVFIGLGLGGPEVGFPPGLFMDVYEEARRQGLHVVAHAGEVVGPESVWGALTELKSERIGHGVRAVDDPKLLEYLAETQIPLEVCPHSNYRLKVTPFNEPHQIRKLVDAGVYCTVNSDDPPMFSTDLTSEYLLLAKQGFSWDELWQLNGNTLEASFLSDEEKATYRTEWDAFDMNEAEK
ncbi:MAG: adenosine deaminase [Anaerolineae bacterium]|jgi:adenosine deaminase|nr:adenosine deaminase [Anaerolineae bacterium]MBT7189368.1 adenosine deaminase [Anaerolineae bacterium]MBT7991728.1 adenosine deaminase [Anaerolineae bacterium]